MRSATEVFGQWLEEGKDIGMQNGHVIPVQNMIDFALKERFDIGDNFRNTLLPILIVMIHQ